jgi:hypothetical protein
MILTMLLRIAMGWSLAMETTVTDPDHMSQKGTEGAQEAATQQQAKKFAFIRFDAKEEDLSRDFRKTMSGEREDVKMSFVVLTKKDT